MMLVLAVMLARAPWCVCYLMPEISGVSPHTLRHSRATHLMQSDVPDWEIAGYLGMSLEVLRKTYAHHSPSAQKRAAEAR